MQVIQTYRYSMLRRLAIAIVLVALCALPVLVFGQTQPAVVPPHVIAIGEGVETVYVGQCPRPSGNMNCMVGMHPTQPYGLMLLFNKHNVLVKVLYLDNVRKAESTLWSHPEAAH